MVQWWGVITGKDRKSQLATLAQKCIHNRKFILGHLVTSKQVNTWDVPYKYTVQGALMRKLSASLLYLVPACSFPLNLCCKLPTWYFSKYLKRALIFLFFLLCNYKSIGSSHMTWIHIPWTGLLRIDSEEIIPYFLWDNSSFFLPTDK